MFKKKSKNPKKNIYKKLKLSIDGRKIVVGFFLLINLWKCTTVDITVLILYVGKLSRNTILCTHLKSNILITVKTKKRKKKMFIKIKKSKKNI